MIRTAALAKIDAPVDIAWLAAFRVLFGLTMSVSMVRFLAYGWVDSFYVRPAFHFKYWGWSFVEALPAPYMHGVFVVLAALGLAIALGFMFRAATVAFVLGFTYLQLIDVTNYLNHYYLASLLGILLAASPAGRCMSVDAWLSPSARQERVRAFWLYLFRFQVAVVYTFAGLAKAHGDWLLHAQPLSIWLASLTDVPLLGPLFTIEGVPLAMSWAGFLFDTSIPWLLAFTRIRPFAFALVIVFHVLTRWLFPIGMFPVIMVLSALVFFSASWPRWLLERLRSVVRRKRPMTRSPADVQRVSDGGSSDRKERASIGPKVRGVLLTAATLYAVVQIALPLRFLAYGGNVRWHEQGMRFSWRVMVREKNGSTTFLVRQKETGRTWYVSPSKYLTRLQEREMSGQPDLILQLAHHIRDEMARDGYGRVEVRVDSFVSLNGRRLTRLIDPEVDLATIDDGLERARWILPAPEEPPPEIQPI